MRRVLVGLAAVGIVSLGLWVGAMVSSGQTESWRDHASAWCNGPGAISPEDGRRTSSCEAANSLLRASQSAGVDLGLRVAVVVALIVAAGVVVVRGRPPVEPSSSPAMPPQVGGSTVSARTRYAPTIEVASPAS